MKHIFVALGPQHVHNFENLIENDLVGNGERILLAGADLQMKRTLWDTVIEADRSLNNNADSIYNQIAAINAKIGSYKKMLQGISSLREEPVTVYVSYIEDVLSNFLFLSFGKDTQAVVVEDGTLNYYDHSLQNIPKLKFFFKQVFAKLHGIPFKRYKGHSSGAHYGHVIANYVTFPQHAFVPKKTRQLPVSKVDIPEFSNSLYIIGQESYGTLLGQEYFEDALETFLERLKKQPFYSEVKQIYYKPHRNGKQLRPELFSEAFADKKVMVVRTEMTSETLYFEELHSKYLAAFDSSTLINIFAKVNENDRKSMSFCVNPLKNDELVPLFSGLGFRFLNKMV